MLAIPKIGRLQVETNLGSVGDASPGTPVTTGGSTSTKGSAAELIASTSFDAYWLTVWAAGYGASATASECCIDILIGAATESVLIADLLAGQAANYANGVGIGKHWHFPLWIPAGSRLAARAAGRRTSTAINVGVTLYGGTTSPPWPCGSVVTTYGIGTVPNGTSITPGASGAEGSWTQVTASTSLEGFAVVPSFQAGNDTTLNARSLSVDIGVGAATEAEIGGPYMWETTGSEHSSGPYGMEWPAFCDIPSGSRLTMRASNSGTNDGAYDCALHVVT